MNRIEKIALVYKIKKMAQPFDFKSPAGSSEGETKPAGATQPTGGGVPASQALNSVGKMQKAMQNFLSVYKAYSAKDTSSQTFNNFITMQYSRSHDEEEQPGVSPTKPIVSFSDMTVGADNNWGPKTNEVLKDIYEFGYNLAGVSKDFNLAGSQDIVNNLTSMSELIPDDLNKVSPQEKEERADKLTPLIQGLTNIYKNYIKNIVKNPAWTRYIAGNEKLMTLQGGDSTGLSANEQKLMKNPNLVANIPTPNGTLKIPLSYLQNVKTFQTLLQQMGVQPNMVSNPEVQKQYLNYLIQNIESSITQASTTQPEATSETAGGIIRETPF